jgi:hypothetical protein
MALLSIRGYARHRQINHTSVLKAIRAGRIHQEANGLIDSERADLEWSSNTDEAKPLNSISGNSKHRRDEDVPTLGARSEGGNGSGRVAGSYASARAAREVVELRIRQIELRRLERTLVDAESVRKEAFNSARAARDALLAIPDRVSAIVAGLDDQHEVHRVLMEEIRNVCEDIANWSARAIPEREEGESEKA